MAPVISQLWSVALAACGLASLWLAGKGRRSAWVIGLAGQSLWLTYAVLTEQLGFVVTAAAYAVVHTRNLVLSRRAHDPEREDG